MQICKNNCAPKPLRWVMLLSASAAALLLPACSTAPVAAPPQKVCVFQSPPAETMQALPNGSLSAGYQAFDQALLAAIDENRISAGQLIALQDAMARRIAELGDAANARLIALQDHVRRALERCAPG